MFDTKRQNQERPPTARALTQQHLKDQLKLIFIGTMFFVLTAFLTTAQAVSIDWDNIGVGNATNLVSGQVVQSLDDAGNCTIAPPFTDCEVEVEMTYQLNNDGNGGQLNCGFGGNNCVRFYNDQIGGITDGDLRLGVDATAADPDDDMRMCIEFNREVEGLQFEILDIDDGSWDDSVELTYVPFVNATPMLSRTDLVDASTFGDLSTGTDPNHVIEHSPGLPAPDNEVLGWGAIQAPAAGNAGAADDGGNVSIDFGTQAVGGFCIRYFAGPNSNANPGFQWIALSQLTWTTTLPVDLAHVASKKTGRHLTVDWSTSAESFNLGFNLWVEKDGEWFALTRNLLPSKVVDSISSQTYSKRVKLSRELRDITRFGISSVDALGSEQFYGPFEVGEDYGEAVLPEPIDWQQAVASHTQRMRSKGYVLKNGRWRKPSANQPAEDALLRADLRFSESGMTRVHHQDLMHAGLDLRGLHRSQIAVAHRGTPIVRRIGKAPKGIFSEDSYIDFYAAPISDELSLYNESNIYQVVQNADLVRVTRAIRHNDENTKAASFSTTAQFENDTLYLNLSKANSPWMESSYGLGAIKDKSIDLNLPDNYLAGSDLALQLNLHGGFDHPEIQDDHSVKVLVNGVELSTKHWSGIEPVAIEQTVTASLLSAAGPNTITLQSIPNTAGFALQYFDRYSMRYALSESEVVGVQGFSVDDDASHLEFSRLEVRGVSAYALDEANNMVRLRPSRSKNMKRFARSSDQKARYFFLKNDDFIAPQSITLTAIKDINTANADLYIVAHPSFIGEELSAYAEHKRGIGVSTEIVDYQELVDQLGHGFNDPFVVQAFLAKQDAAQYGSSALIVGGHSFDYLDKTSQGSISFIPTTYRPSDVINYSPSDTPLTDIDSDGLSDVAIGRWPVRSLDDLNSIIQKSTAWGNNEGLASSTSVLLIAEQEDSNNGLSFAQQLNDLSGRFDTSNAHQGGFWGSVTRLYASDFANSATPVADQKAAMQAELEAGHALTIFNGHGSTNSWTYSGLFRTSDIGGIQDQGKASIYFPLACYTTYYETIGNNSLAHQLLFKADGGAVMIVGAATLGDFTSNGKMADRVMQSQIDDGLNLGQSLMTAKRAMGLNKQNESNLWTMLGDPTLQYNAAYVKPDPTSTGNVEVD